jgi:hypothetical protein
MKDEATLAVDEGCITFTRKFKCLGSLIAQDLKDNDDILRQINQAKAQVQELTNMWMSKDITTEFKKMVHIQLPLNTALWGAKSTWTLTTTDNERKLESFHHKSSHNSCLTTNAGYETSSSETKHHARR